MLKSGRRTASGWVGGALAASLVIGSLVASAPVANAGDGALTAPLPRAATDPYLVAASGDILLNLDSGTEDDLVSLSTDRGQSWTDVDAALKRALFVEDGVLSYEVVGDVGTPAVLHVRDLATGTEADPVTFPADRIEAAGRDYVVYGTNGSEDEEPTAFAAAPVDDPAAATGLVVPAHTRDLLHVLVGTGDKGVAVSTDRGSGQRALDGYLDVVALAGGDAGYDALTVPGLTDAAVRGETLYYLVGSSTSAQLCRRSFASADAWHAGASCVTVKKGDYRAAFAGPFAAGPSWASLMLWTGTDTYVGSYVADWTAATPKLLTLKGSGAVKKVYPIAPVSDLERPLVIAYTSYSPTGLDGYIATVGTTGALTRFAAWPTIPTQPYQLSLSANRLGGLDRRSGGTAWVRDLTRPAAERVLATKARDVLVSAGRTAVNSSAGLVLTDQGVQTGKLAAWSYLWQLSGPYVLGRTSTKATKDTLLLGTKAIAFAKDEYPQAIFGSRVAVLVNSATEWAVKVVDYAGGTPVEINRFDLDLWYENVDIRLWGDTLALTGWYSDDSTEIVIHDVRGTTPTWSTTSDTGTQLVDLSDNVGLLWSPEDGVRTMDLTTKATQAVDDTEYSPMPSLDAAGRIAYTTEEEIVIRQLSFAGSSAPRALWSSAPASFNSKAGESSPFRVSVDATKALAGGTLVIDGQGPLSGTSVSVPVEASADGSLRMSWDGKVEGDNEVAPAGTYAWRLEGFDGLVAVDGTTALGGTFTVTNDPVPYPQVTPVIDSTKPATGQVLTADPGPHPSDATIAYQWYAGSTAIPDGKAAAYEVRPADVGKTLKVKVTFPGTKNYLGSSRTSAATSKVAKGTLAKGTVTLDDPAPQVDAPVSAVLDGWGPAPVTPTYQWYRVSTKNKATAISKQTKAAYTPTGADVGYRLKVVVTGTKAGYTSAAVSSALSPVVLAGAYEAVPTPEVTGTARVDMTLKAVPGTYASADGAPVTPAFTYQWYRVNGAVTTAIKGATGSTYRATAADLGLTLKVRVTAKRSGYPTATTDSGTTDPVASPMKAGTVTIDGVPATGSELTATLAGWVPEDVTGSYQWYRGTTAISGANAAAYTPVAADLGKKLRVRVVGAAEGYASVTVYSAYTVAVVAGK